MDGEFSEINVTPFTDVLLVLLVIFMILAALVIPPGFEKQLPNGCGCTHPAATHLRPPLDVTVTNAGTIFVGNVRTNETGVYSALSAAAQKNSKVKLRVIADAHARYGLVIRVLDAAKAASLNDVTFVAQ